MKIIILALTMLTTFLITGNNSSILAGPYTSITSLKKIASITIILGISAGFMEEGYKLRRFTLAFKVNDYFMISVILLTTIILLEIANRYKLPISLTTLLAGAIIGISFAYHTQMDIMYLTYLAISWAIYPVLGLAVAGIIYIGISQVNRKISWREYKYEKILLIISTFFLSYVFGANTLGLLNSLLNTSGIEISILILLFAWAGYLLLFKQISSKVGLGIYNIGVATLLSTQFTVILLIEIATQYGIPISLTQLWMISLLGPGLTKEVRLINKSYISKIIILWALSPFIGATLSYVFIYILTML